MKTANQNQRRAKGTITQVQAHKLLEAAQRLAEWDATPTGAESARLISEAASMARAAIKDITGE